MKLLIFLANLPVAVLVALVFCAFLFLLLFLLLVACSAQATDRIIRVLDALQELYYCRVGAYTYLRGKKRARRHGRR